MPPTILIISQVYPPDPTSVGQHVADAAAELVKRGYRVRVLTSARGYDDPSQKYPIRETRDGVEVRRLPLSSFGKRSIAVRVAGQLLFVAQAILRGVFTGGLRGIMVSTSPPMASLAALAVSYLRGAPITYWLMDLNPDQVVALGKMREGAPAVRLLRRLNRVIWGRAKDIVVLDRFMLARVLKHKDISAKATVMPPWPHEDDLERVPHDRNPFREKHGLGGKFVVMYSGNHGHSTPIATVLDAADRLRHREDIVFMFIGGGVRKQEVDARIAAGATNVRSLPYQPLSEIRYSLSAADAHLVSVGDEVVGIVHPCKVYGAMAVARPVLLLGPDPCHVSDLIGERGFGWHVRHGDVDGAVRTIEAMAATPREVLERMGNAAADVIRTSLSKDVLCGKFCDVVTRGLPPELPPGLPPARPEGQADGARREERAA